MKKIILIISAVLLALGILGCAVTALPTLLEGEKYMNNIIDKNSEKQEFTFTDTFSGLDISVLSANANISYNSGNAVKVSYVTVDKNKKIECNITDGTLNIKEKSGFSFFSLFTLASVPTKIEISFPESYRDNGTLENADVTVASGSLSGDMPHTEKSDANVGNAQSSTNRSSSITPVIIPPLILPVLLSTRFIPAVIFCSLLLLLCTFSEFSPTYSFTISTGSPSFAHISLSVSPFSSPSEK